MLPILEEKIENFNRRFGINLSLLIALCLVAQHSFLVKFASIALLVLLNLGSFKKLNRREIPLFYALIAGLEVLKFIFLNEQYNLPHFLQFSMGMIYWVSAFLLCWLISYNVKQHGKVPRTLQVVALLNLLFTLFQFIRICVIENTINPFNSGHNHPYGISTGDLLSGLFHGVHLTNAFVSLFLCLYFIYNKNHLYTFFTLLCLLLTGNNYATLVFALGAGILFITAGGKERRIGIGAAALFTILFYVIITPLNAEYMLEKVAHISATLPNSRRVLEKEDAQKANGEFEIAVADTSSPYDIEAKDAKKVLVYGTGADSLFNFVAQSGKVRSYYQTKKFLLSSPVHFLFGAGMGGFSSKLAFNSSGVMEGSSLSKLLPKYETSYFKNNHKALYSFLKTQHIMFHSESNRPFSVYNQLLGEYGLVGFLLFILSYLWYFMKRLNRRRFALPILVTLLVLLNIDYLFESLSVLLFVETLLFLDLKESDDVAKS